MRFAYQHLAKPVANLFKGAGKTDLAMRFGPDLGYAVMAGTAFAPEGATMGDRAGMFGEDLVMGVGSSIAGQLVGRRVGMGRAKAGLNKARASSTVKGGEKTVYQGRNSSGEEIFGLTPEGRKTAVQQAQNTVQGFQSGGDVIGQMGMVMLPRPISQGVYEAAGERANQTQEQISANQQGMVEEQQLSAALVGLAQGGYLATDHVSALSHLGAGPMQTTATRQVGY